MRGYDRAAITGLQHKLRAIQDAAVRGNREAIGNDASILQGEIKKTLNMPGRGRVYKSRGITSRFARKGTKARARQEHRASAPGDPPAKDTAFLQVSVGIFPEGDASLRVGPTAEYAAALEFGTMGGGQKRSVRFRRGPQVNRKALAATLRRKGAYSLARSVIARGGSGGRIAPRPYMGRSLEAARPRMVASHVSIVQAHILDAARL